MLRVGGFLRVASQCRVSFASSSRYSFDHDPSEALGEQRAHYRVDLRKRLRNSNDTRFDVKDYQRDLTKLSGFNGWQRPNVSGFGGQPRRGTNNFGAGLKPKNFFSEANLPLINRDYYVEHADVAGRPQAEIDAFLAQHEITLEGKDIPRPIFAFEEANFDAKILDLLRTNYERPTSIQSISWPVALACRDLISIARTGSGKTLCFLLPGLIHALHQTPRQPNESNAPCVLVMVPTRELAQQVEEVAREYCRALRLHLVCLFGGASKNVQASRLAHGADVCVATPGRLLDFLEAGAISMHRCSYLVLDEADRMLDMGFEPQIRRVVSQIRPDRQTLMFSATWPPEIRNLATDFQREPVFMNVGSLELSANHNITQNVAVLPSDDHKQERLFELLGEIVNEPEFKALIFVQTKRRADQITALLRRQGHKALAIHGDKSQSERNWVLQNFRNGNSNILLATDVAARGLDVDDIKHVVNYDFPNSSEDYVHRIGRTGRRDKKGTSHTFLTVDNAEQVAGLIKVLEEAGQTVSYELRQLGMRKPIQLDRHPGRSFSNTGRPANVNRAKYDNTAYKARVNYQKDW